MALPERGCKTGDNHLCGHLRVQGHLGGIEALGLGSWGGEESWVGGIWEHRGQRGLSRGSACSLHPEHKSAPQNIMGENL